VSSHLRAAWWEEELGSERGVTARCNAAAWFPKSSRVSLSSSDFTTVQLPGAAGAAGVQRRLRSEKAKERITHQTMK